MAYKRSENYVQMDGNPNLYLTETKEIAVSYSLRQLKLGLPVEFSRDDIDISSLRSVASRLEKKGLKFAVTNPKEDNWQTAYVVRIQ